MTNDPTSRNRWRPKFSIRTMVVVVTLVCVVLASWVPTARNGERDVVEFLRANTGSRQSGEISAQSMAIGAHTIENAAVVFPFVVLVDEWHPTHEAPFGTRRKYYFWFYGHVARLP